VQLFRSLRPLVPRPPTAVAGTRESVCASACDYTHRLQLRENNVLGQHNLWQARERGASSPPCCAVPRTLSVPPVLDNRHLLQRCVQASRKCMPSSMPPGRVRSLHFAQPGNLRSRNAPHHVVLTCAVFSGMLQVETFLVCSYTNHGLLAHTPSGKLGAGVSSYTLTMDGQLTARVRTPLPSAGPMSWKITYRSRLWA